MTLKERKNPHQEIPQKNSHPAGWKFYINQKAQCVKWNKSYLYGLNLGESCAIDNQMDLKKMELWDFSAKVWQSEMPYFTSKIASIKVNHMTLHHWAPS